MAGKKGNYSKVIIYDERRRYYYLWPQRNRPFLDDEIRDMGVGLLDQARRAVQKTWGDVAAPYNAFSASAVSTENAFKVVESTSPSLNFTVTGGTTGGASLDHPAVLYAKGFYIFLADDLEYTGQMYSSGSIDLNTESDKYKTLTSIPALTTPGDERIDIVYVHLHFEEVASEAGSDVDVYRDSGLKNHLVGTDTANRLRAVIDIRVREGWTDPIDANIFTHSEFLGATSPNDSDPTDEDFKVPIAVVYRHNSINNILQADIVDLLSVYDKRVKSLDEVSWRIRHGGYTQADVDQKNFASLGYTGFSVQFPGAVVDEGAFATGLNQGLGTEAFNSDSVTPRVVDQTGKFMMGALLVGHETGVVTYETGAEMLHAGEIVAKDESLESLYVGYDRGYTGLAGPTGIREYRHNVSVYAKGVSGTVGVEVVIENGDTGAQAVLIRSRETGMAGNYVAVDRLGRLGVNTLQPGWDTVESLWGLSGANVAVDINATERIRENLVVDGDIKVGGGMQGRTWVVPAALTELNPAVFGWTGGQQGITGAVACVIIKRGVAVMGESGLMGYGYTGVAGQYECYDLEGHRMFTIGDLGPEFDRTVKTLYGTGVREAYASDLSFLALPGGFDYLQVGDTVTYDILREEGQHVTGALTVTQSAWQAIEELRDDIIYNTGWGAPTGMYRQYVYMDTRGITGSIDDPLTTFTGIGEAWGVQIIDNIYGFTGAGYTGALDDSHGKIIIKEMPEDPVHAEIRSIVTFKVSRSLLTDLAITFTPYHYYGSGGYGGDVQGMKFAKLDLGEAADAWLFNGDVFFNGVGGRNQVVFSPNVIFRDDVMMYGTLFADQLRFNFARVGSLGVDNDIIIDRDGEFARYLGVGDGSLAAVKDMQGSHSGSDPTIKVYIKGGVRATKFAAESDSSDTNEVGGVYWRNSASATRNRMYAKISGTVGSTSDPFGLHLVDDRTSATKLNTFVVDYRGAVGETGQSVTLDVRGDVKASGGIVVPFLGVGNTTTTNADYPLYVAGRGYVGGELSVESLRFVGAEAPSGDTDIVTPVNVAIVDSATQQQTFHNNEIILRNKNFTVTERIYLNNQNNLGNAGVTAMAEYYDGMTTLGKGLYGHDTLTFLESEINTLVSSGNDVYVDQITNASLKRYAFSHVNVCTLGTIRTQWTGYAYDPTGAIDERNTIQSYEFESPYFRDRNGGSVISWMPGARFGDDNYVVRIQGNLIDTHSDFPAMYAVDGCLAVYLPKSKWWGYGTDADQPSTEYRSFVVWYPYESVLTNFNTIPMVQQTLCGGFTPVAEWKVGLYPRLVKQTRLPFDTTAGSNQERMYIGEWDLDVVVFPTVIGRCANLTGQLYISYVQT